MLGGYTGKDGHAAALLAQLIIGETLHLGACEHAVASGHDAQLGGNGRGGEGVVARNHHGLDACTAALLDGKASLLAWRVYHAHHAHEGEAIFDACSTDVAGQLIHIFIGNGQHAQCLGGHLLVLLKYAVDVVTGDVPHRE